MENSRYFPFFPFSMSSFPVHRSKVISIVEGHSELRSLLRILISGYGYRVTESANHREALEKANRQRPDLFLIDISAQPTDALSVVKTIRHLDGCREIPVIGLARYTSNFFHQAIQAGCSELLEKPLDFGTLKFILKQYLS